MYNSGTYPIDALKRRNLTRGAVRGSFRDLATRIKRASSIAKCVIGQPVQLYKENKTLLNEMKWGYTPLVIHNTVCLLNGPNFCLSYLFLFILRPETFLMYHEYLMKKLNLIKFDTYLPIDRFFFTEFFSCICTKARIII